MPTIRCHLRNEYGLGNSDLYRTADKDDPEAVIEGVGMAGLVGLLRQLGDLAELAADIFQDLQEEITNTSSRRHGVMRRIQQLETELPLMEKNILAQPTYSQFSCSEGMEWHGDQKIGQNLVTVIEMPSFVMNSYKECRDPPKLFMLDKFDVSGDGACLKRYTDPSIYRTTSLATLVEEEARLERHGYKLKKKLHCEDSEIPQLSTSEDNSRFKPISDHDPVEAQSKIAALKSRRTNINGSCIRNYMEHLLEIHSLENKLPFESSLSNDMRSAVINVCDIEIDASGATVRSRKPTLPEDVMIVSPICESEKQMMEKNGSKKHPVKPSFQFLTAKNSKVDNRKLLSDDTNKIDVHLDNWFASDNLLDASISPDIEHTEFSTDAETVTGESFDGYLSDEFASEMDNYTDALTTMDSETEMDQRSKVDSRLGEPQDMDADLNAEQLCHESQLCQQHPLANSSDSPGFSTLFRKGVANPSFSDTLGNLAAELLVEKRTSSTLTLTSNTNQSKSGDIESSDIFIGRSRRVEMHSTSSFSRFHSGASYYSKPWLITDKDKEGTESYDSDIDPETIQNSVDPKLSESTNQLTYVSQSEETYPSTDSNLEEINEQESKQLNLTPAYRVNPSPSVQSSDGKCSVDHLLDNLAEFSESENCFDSEKATQYSCISLKGETVLPTQYHAISAEVCEEISVLVVDRGVDIVSYEQCDSASDSPQNQSERMLSYENKVSNVSKKMQEINMLTFVASEEFEESDTRPLTSFFEVDEVSSEGETSVQSLTTSNNAQSSQIVQSSPVASLDIEIPEPQIPFSTESAVEGEISRSPSRLNTGLPPIPPPVRKPRLIVAVSSHDKSQPRKAPELFCSAALPKLNERGAYLEQIRNKSFSLKPTALTTPSLKFKGDPPTNLKVIAILEKANAIRQACAGSDEDEDSWSDS